MHKAVQKWKDASNLDKAVFALNLPDQWHVLWPNTDPTMPGKGNCVYIGWRCDLIQGQDGWRHGFQEYHHTGGFGAPVQYIGLRCPHQIGVYHPAWRQSPAFVGDRYADALSESCRIRSRRMVVFPKPGGERMSVLRTRPACRMCGNVDEATPGF